MSDNRQMERKLNVPAPKSLLQANSKTDAKKSTEFQAWKKNYELKNGIEYIKNTGQKKCKDGQRYYYKCCRTGFHKEGENLKRMIKTQGSKKINQNCTSHIILFESFEDKCVVTFYKEHYGHKEIELQHIKIPDIKKHEIAAKLSQGVTFKRVLDDVRENIGNSLKREDLITRSDLHNIKQKYNLNLKDGQFHKSDATSVDIWVEQMKKEEENNCVIYYKKQDSSNSKHTNRRNGKAVNIQPQRVEANRNISFKKNSNNSKQPQPRASLFCRKKSSEVTESLNDVDDDDILPVLRHMDHNNKWNMRSGYGSRKKEFPQKFNVKHFLIANCQFVVKFGKDYSQWMFDQDEIVDWDCIEQIKMFSTQFIKCPICMDIPITPKMTCCGHIYCWPCILRYLDINEELDTAGCPICHSRILKKELKSVEIIIKEECCVGQSITLQLMKRARNSLQAYPMSELRKNNFKPSDDIPLSACESNYSTAYSRLLIGYKSLILNILNQEREALVLLLDYWETEDAEKKYIFEALELLSKREDILMNQEPNLEIKKTNCESINPALNSNLGSPPPSSLQSQLKNFLEIPGCSHNDANVLDENPKLHIKEMKTNLNDFNNVAKEVLQKKPAKKDFFFYQALDGQHIYLSAVNVEMLECMFGSLENSPQQIDAIVIEKKSLSMTEASRKRYRFLLHLPITTVFEWVELDLSNIVSQETLFIFKTNLDEKKAIRDRRARDEQRLAKRIEERNSKKELPLPEWHNRSLFPECGYDPFADKSMVPLSKSIGITLTSDHAIVNTSNGSPSNLSFAKALQNENTASNSSSSDHVSPNVSSQWPIVGSRPNSMSMNNILEDAVANISLHGIDNSKSKNKKKKRSKYEPIF